VEWLLTKTIEAGRKAGVISERSVEAVIVDTTVMEKAIAHPGPKAINKGGPSTRSALLSNKEKATQQNCRTC
jgi:hypothetical protein